MAEHSLEKLVVFQRAVELSDLSWGMLDLIPKPFKFSTGDQFIRSADSIAANIAEAHGKYTFRDKRKYFHNSRGSLGEFRFWFRQICKRFNIPDNDRIKVEGQLPDRVELQSEKLC